MNYKQEVRETEPEATVPRIAEDLREAHSAVLASLQLAEDMLDRVYGVEPKEVVSAGCNTEDGLVGFCGNLAGDTERLRCRLLRLAQKI